jgi:hypothetical protein
MDSSVVYCAAPIFIKLPERKNLNLQLTNLNIAWFGTKGSKWEVIDCQFEHTWFGTLGMKCGVFEFDSQFESR